MHKRLDGHVISMTPIRWSLGSSDCPAQKWLFCPKIEVWSSTRPIHTRLFIPQRSWSYLRFYHLSTIFTYPKKTLKKTVIPTAGFLSSHLFVSAAIAAIAVRSWATWVSFRPSTNCTRRLPTKPCRRSWGLPAYGMHMKYGDMIRESMVVLRGGLGCKFTKFFGNIELEIYLNWDASSYIWRRHYPINRWLCFSICMFGSEHISSLLRRSFELRRCVLKFVTNSLWGMAVFWAKTVHDST